MQAKSGAALLPPSARSGPEGAVSVDIRTRTDTMPNPARDLVDAIRARLSGAAAEKEAA